MRSACLCTLLLTFSILWSSTATADVLLIPDSAGDKIWAFDPYDGSLLADDYIPDDGRLIQPISVTDSGYGTLLISDEIADAVFEYAVTGKLLRVVADAADGLDALQGITVRYGSAYVGSRTSRSIFEIDLFDGGISVWAANVGTPRDIVFRAKDALITNSDSEANGGENIERYGLDGLFIETFHDSDGVTGIDFPQQLQVETDGSILAAGFTTPRGLYSYDATGNEIAARTNLITSPRGVVRLGNGQLLYAGGDAGPCATTPPPTLKRPSSTSPARASGTSSGRRPLRPASATLTVTAGSTSVTSLSSSFRLVRVPDLHASRTSTTARSSISTTCAFSCAS